MNCPHCGGLIEVIAGMAARDPQQKELPLMYELRSPGKYAKKVIDARGRENHAGASAAHEHDHEHDLRNRKTRGHEHDHEHGGVHELSGAEQDLLDQVEELVASENRTAHFRTTWILRIKDYPTQVFAAIGEARSAKREGRVRKSVGGVLNWHFEKFRSAHCQRSGARAAQAMRKVG